VDGRRAKNGSIYQNDGAGGRRGHDGAERLPMANLPVLHRRLKKVLAERLFPRTSRFGSIPKAWQTTMTIPAHRSHRRRVKQARVG